MPKILYIVNPAAYGGRGNSIWNKYLKLLPDKPESDNILVTERPGHAQEVVSGCSGYDIIAAVGGDGTVGEVISGIMQLKKPHPVLGIIPAGTGNDTARSLGINSPKIAKLTLFRQNIKEIDLIKIRCSSDIGDVERYAVVFCSVGLGSESIRQVKPWMKRFLGATISYYLGTLIGVLLFCPPSMRISWNDGMFEGAAWLVLVGNAEWGGGQSMCVAPGARIDDGKFNVTIVKGQSKYRLLSKLPLIASGKHINDSLVSYFPAEKLTIETNPPTLLSFDGDLLGQTPAEFSICPAAIQILTPG